MARSVKTPIRLYKDHAQSSSGAPDTRGLPASLGRRLRRSTVGRTIPFVALVVRHSEEALSYITLPVCALIIGPVLQNRVDSI